MCNVYQEGGELPLTLYTFVLFLVCLLLTESFGVDNSVYSDECDQYRVSLVFLHTIPDCLNKTLQLSYLCLIPAHLYEHNNVLVKK